MTTATTRNTIIARAFRRIGMDSPATEEVANAADLLRLVVQGLDPEARWLWKVSNTETELSLVAGQRSYGVSDGLPSDIYALEPDAPALLRGTSRIPLRVITKNEAVSSVELEPSSGEPYLLYFERKPNPANNKIHVLPTPAATDTLSFVYQATLLTFAAGASTPDFPPEFELDMVKILAAELGPEYGYAGDMQGQLQQFASEARRRFVAFNKERTSAKPACGVYF